ncbi:hypothetical protein ACFV24_16020 [Nocardia fluminea]|uniref:hypothetical protein n=1 Tax=Nocardia fluminea TaxID=134984 RepID=UPI00366C88BD
MTSAHEPSMSQRHGELLRRVQNVAAQLREVTDAGPGMFDDGVSADSQLVWTERLETLRIESEHAEFEAMLEGVDPGWVLDARELGKRGAKSPSPHVVRSHPARANEAQEFYLDMLEVDLWNLERMASLEAARVDRIATGRWSFDHDPIAAAQFADNMAALHNRVTVLAAAAQLTPAEGDSLWGSSVEGIRRVHAVTFAAYDEQALAQEWNGYARADPALAVPPYVPRDPETGKPTDPAAVGPPTPGQMLADARSALRVQFVDTAIRDSESTDLAAESTAITAVVDAALGEDREWTWEPDHDPAAGRGREISTDRGPEL